MNKISNFLTRTISSIVFVIIVLASLFSYISFASLLIIIFCGCVWELFRLIKRNNKLNPFWKQVTFVSLSLVYICLPLFLLFQLYTAGHGLLLVLSIFIMLWLNDAGAYIIGSAIGKHKLCPKISPSKTWEGSIGGFLTTLLIGILLFFCYENLFSFSEDYNYERIFFWLSLAAVVSIFGTLGDLFESWLKRCAGVKDSGKIMPGHGGFLDRFDSLLFATIAVFGLIYITYF